jgi:hypothetical protein
LKRARGQWKERGTSRYSRSKPEMEAGLEKKLVKKKEKEKEKEG